MPSADFLLSDLRLRTPLVELRVSTRRDLDTLIAIQDQGLHDPRVRPFSVAWTDRPREQRVYETMTYWQEAVESWGTPTWAVSFAVIARDRGEVVIGQQMLRANDEDRSAPVSTNSWLGREFHNQGYGTHMRAAVLAFAFETLQVPAAASASFVSNPSSWRISEKLGYVEVGRRTLAPRGEPQECMDMQVRRDRFMERQASLGLAVEILGDTQARDVFPVRYDRNLAR